VLKIFLSHCTRNFKAKITLSPEISPPIKRSVLMENVGNRVHRAIHYRQARASGVLGMLIFESFFEPMGSFLRMRSR
jgi:hypothetical protein